MTTRFWKYLCCILICAVLLGVFAYTLAPDTSLPDVPDTGTPMASTTLLHTTVPATTLPQTTAPPATVGPAPTQSAPTEPEPTQPVPTDPRPTEPAPTQPTEPEPSVQIPKLSAKYAFVYDQRSGEFLYNSCKTSRSLYPASVTKLFTTYVALQHLAADQQIRVGSELSYVKSDASVAGFKKGDTVSAEALAYGALLPSGCDASYILAAAAGREILGDADATAKEAIKAFLAECNRVAQKLGMTNTNIASVDGYHDEDHYISVKSFAIIGTLCLKDKLIAKIVSSDTMTVRYTNAAGEGCKKTFKNTNRTIQDGDKYHHSDAVGLKTGFTDDAGYCLLTAYRVEGGYILVGIFKCSSASSRFSDANKLFDAFEPFL